MENVNNSLTIFVDEGSKTQLITQTNGPGGSDAVVDLAELRKLLDKNSATSDGEHLHYDRYNTSSVKILLRPLQSRHGYIASPSMLKLRDLMTEKNYLFRIEKTLSHPRNPHQSYFEGYLYVQ